MPVPKAGRPERPQDSSAPSTTRIFVGNLPYKFQAAQVESMFNENGLEIDHVMMRVNPHTGLNMGWARVDISTAQKADSACNILDGVVVLGRRIRVRPFEEGRRSGGQLQNEPSSHPDRGENSESKQGWS